MTTLPHDVVETNRDRSLDSIALNESQRFLLANRTPERDSILDDFNHLRAFMQQRGIPAVEVDLELVGLVQRLSSVIALNDREYDVERDIAGDLDDLSRALHAGLRDANAASAGTVKQLAAELRPLLRVLADHSSHGPQIVAAAGVRVHRLVAGWPQIKLRANGLRGELGHGPHGLLVDLLDEVAR